MGAVWPIPKMEITTQTVITSKLSPKARVCDEWDFISTLDKGHLLLCDVSFNAEKYTEI